MAKVGGKRPGAGRPAGAKNKATAEVKAAIADLLSPHVPRAIQTLIDVMENGSSESARVAAAQAIFDRVYGKPIQAVGGPDGGPIQVQMIRRVIVDPAADE